MKKLKTLLGICALSMLIAPQIGHAVQINTLGTMNLQGKFRTSATVRTETMPGTRLDIEAGDLIQQRNKSFF